MPRFVEKHQKRQVLDASKKRLQDLGDYIYLEIEDGISSRKALESVWRNCLKMYEGVPKYESRDVPIENAPNVEITIGAIAADTINAQAVDLIFNTTPLVTVRPKPNLREDKETIAAAKEMQKFVNHLGASPDVNAREAIETAVLDDVQLGTGLLYTPFIEKTKKTKTAKVLSRTPRFISMPTEDVVIPGGTSQTMDEMPIVALRFYYTLPELMDLSRANKWDLTGIEPVGASDWVRSRRENLGRHIEGKERKGYMFDIYIVYTYFDIDNDGYDEDLVVIWNHTGRSILWYGFNSMDRRPVEKMVYQRRAHMHYGIGVLEMLRNFEEKLTDVHNYSTLNILLANSRVWLGTDALPKTLKIWPGKYIQTSSTDDLVPLQMADVYTSIWQEQQVLMQLANQRVGISDTGSGADIPSRTPGVTAMTFLQQVNRRFTPAFDSMRSCISRSFGQCLYRYQERILAGDTSSEATIFQVLGYEAGMKVIRTLQNESFDEQVDIELTAASASINREADRQNAVMLTNILGQYYQRTLELISIASNPQTPPEVRSLARKIAEAGGEVIDRTIRTFDQIRDPATFVVEVESEMNQLEAQGGSPQMALQQIMGALAEQQQQLPERTMV